MTVKDKINSIREILNDYEQFLYRCGSAEEQDRVLDVLKYLDELENMVASFNG